MLQRSVVFLFAAFVCGEAAIIDTLGKCSIKDSICLAKLYTTTMSSVAKTGIPEYGIPPFDPFDVKNITVSVLNMVDIGMVDGVVKNIKGCVFDHVVLSFDDPHVSMKATCDVTIKGHYKVVTTNPIVKNILGSTVQGEGFGKVKTEKISLHFETDLFLREDKDDIYIDWKFEGMRYNYTFGKTSFSANNIQIGGAEVSNQIISLMNENSEFLMSTFGKPFIDVAVNIIYTYMHKFFDATPAKFYLIEDLREFKKN